jgi:hypothetical protein
MMQFAASAAAIFTHTYSSSGHRHPPLSPLLLPPGPPYTGGDKACPPRPRQKVSLAREAACLKMSSSNWVWKTPIKCQGPAQAGGRSPPLQVDWDGDNSLSISRSACGDWAKTTRGSRPFPHSYASKLPGGLRAQRTS